MEKANKICRVMGALCVLFCAIGYAETITIPSDGDAWTELSTDALVWNEWERAISPEVLIIVLSDTMPLLNS